MGMATCTQASGISVVFLKVLYAIRLDKQTIKSASRPLLGHLSSCVPSILRCFGSKYGQICKELPKHHKLLVLVLPMICKDSRYFRAACGVFTPNMQESEKTP